MNKRKNKLMTLGCMACLSLAILSSPATVLPAQAAPAAPGIMPMKDSIEWVFDIRDHKLYRRLFNYSTDNWIGEWEYICDVPAKNKSEGGHMGKN